ncbi:hypothetical protein [Bradyrhizobium sp. DOA9]|uniref:hypothetical protein n=1 Tax=Bradyrhizobium sp. DOA9 TaxID=1126627 RepID=UPI00046A445F|nr:hypothetical protein [Bradyrhizobium sp. DOA9]GAJ37508.1 hypothetical protein BDOA9_0201250 [Bradyrhizobium sp. DOA9]
MGRILLFFLITFVVFAAIVGGLLYTADHWMPLLAARFGKPEETNKLFVVLPAAIATVLAALTSGVGALLQAGAQRSMNRDLAAQKAKIDEDLDKKRNDLLKELEDKKTDNMKILEGHKTSLAKDLDKHRDEISRKRAELDEQIDCLKEARDVATYYRFHVGQLRTGTYSIKETKPYHSKLAIIQHRLPGESELLREWRHFTEWGHALEEKAERRKAPGQIEVWEEIVPDHGARELGLIFAGSAQRVLALIEEEMAKLRAIH